jgi:hypothetical protein
MPDWIVDLIKIGAGLLLYGVIPLGAAVLLRSVPRAAAGLAAAMLVLTALPPGWTTVYVANQAEYRGHVRGFEIALIDAVALTILWGALLAGRGQLRGAWRLALPWLLYVGVCTLSLVQALDPGLALMAVWKNLKVVLPLLAAYAAVGSERELRTVIAGATTALLVQTGAGLWDRYGHGTFRIRAWFEHSNSLAIWAYMVAMPVLAAALCRHERPLTVSLRLLAVIGAAALSIMALARASMAAFAAGAVLVVVATVLFRPSLRSVAAGCLVCLALALGAFKGMDSIQARMAGAEHDSEVEDFRVVLNHQAGIMFADNRLLGVGWNNYGKANSRPDGAYSWVIEEWDRDRGHRYDEGIYVANALTESLYWLHLAENGLLGTAAYLQFMAATWILVAWVAWRQRRNLVGAVAMGLLVALSLAYVHGLVERVLVQPKNLATWLILVGAVVGAGRARSEVR